MSIYQGDKELTDTDLRLFYYEENGNWQQPTFKIKLTNDSNLDLYCALLDLSDLYEVSAELMLRVGCGYSQENRLGRWMVSLFILLSINNYGHKVLPKPKTYSN